jgi:hypothetical protein
MLILLLIVALLSYSMYVAYTGYAQTLADAQEEVEKCLGRYTERHCTVSSQTEECKHLADCIKQKKDGETFVWAVLKIFSKDF